MAEAAAILARVRARGADVVLGANGLRLVNRSRLPAGAEQFIAGNAAAIADLLRDEADAFEERAAIVEFEANAPRARAEEFARLCIEASRHPQRAELVQACGAIIEATFGSEAPF